MDPVEILAQIEASVIGPRLPDTEGLKSIRTTLDDPGLRMALQEHVLGLNDPEVIASLLQRISNLVRTFSDLAEDRRFNSEIGARVGVGTGVGLVAGSIIAAVSAPLPIITLIVIGGGLYMAGTGYFYGRKLGAEAHIYRNLSDRLARIRESLDVR